MNEKKIIGQPVPGPNKLRPTDVIAIPLPQGGWGYARILNGAGMAVLRLRSAEIRPLHEVQGAPVAFFVEYREPYDISPWIYLGKWPFQSEQDAWGPPTYFQDTTARKTITLLHRGKAIRGVSESEVAGLSRQRLVSPADISSRIAAEVR